MAPRIVHRAVDLVDLEGRLAMRRLRACPGHVVGVSAARAAGRAASRLAVMLLELDAELREFAHQLDRLDESTCSAVVTGERELLPPR